MLEAYCDYKSVGVIIRNPQKEILMFDRATFPLKIACVAGHVDTHGSYEEAARAETFEEVGLVVTHLTLAAEKWMKNPCRRYQLIQPGGHQWRVYYAEVENYELQPSERETKNVRWYNVQQIQVLAQEEKLEPVWREWFHILGILPGALPPRQSPSWEELFRIVE